MRLFVFVLAATLPLSAQWTTVGGNAQHTGLSTVGAQPFPVTPKWSTPVDQNLAGTAPPSEILAHFGAPIITTGNTVLVPVHTSSGAYEIEVHNGVTGAIKWTLSTNWTPPADAWAPSYGPGLSARNRFYYPGIAGTVYYLDTPDTNSGPPGQLAFYGAPNSGYTDLHVSTPIVSDKYGDIFFGFIVSGPNAPSGMTSGIARIAYDGTGSWTSAVAAANLTPTESIQLSINQVPINGAPALSVDSTKLYFATNSGGFSGGYLVEVNSVTFAPIAHVRLIDPNTQANAIVPDIGSAVPTVGPDGDVYYGVLESDCPGACSNDDRGWLLHFTSALTTSPTKPPGAFGWDDTASIVPYSLVPSYHGASSYLLFTKYNNYAGVGPHGNGQNKIAILDPNDTQVDPVTGATVMKEVITILGQTPEGGGFREWCINNAAIDKLHKSAVVNSEDGVLYWWDFTTNTFTQKITLTAGVGEAYTPTVIGPDGTVYAINDGYLFAVHP